MVNNYVTAQTGEAFSTDPVVSLFTYLSDNWDQDTGYNPPASNLIKFDSKFGLATGFYNYVIVERMPSKDTDLTLGRARKRIFDYFRVQVFCQGKSAINNRWNMEMHIRSIIDANPTALRTSGIDEMGITAFTTIVTENSGDADVTNRIPSTKGNWISRSRATCEMIYDLVAT